MITSEEARHMVVFYEEDDYQDKMLDYITQQEELTTTVKRYFELKVKGITTEDEALEHRELLNQ
jgi:uncharacterized protein YeeX (DUF496 family)